MLEWLRTRSRNRCCVLSLSIAVKMGGIITRQRDGTKEAGRRVTGRHVLSSSSEHPPSSNPSSSSSSSSSSSAHARAGGRRSERSSRDDAPMRPPLHPSSSNSISTPANSNSTFTHSPVITITPAKVSSRKIFICSSSPICR